MNDILRQNMLKQKAMLLPQVEDGGSTAKAVYTLPGYLLLRRHFKNYVIKRLFFGQTEFRKFWTGDFQVRTDAPASEQLMYAPRRIATIGMAYGLDASTIRHVETALNDQMIPGAPDLIDLDDPSVLPEVKALLLCWVEMHQLDIDLSWPHPCGCGTLMACIVGDALERSYNTRHQYYLKKGIEADKRYQQTVAAHIQWWLHENPGEHSPLEITKALNIQHPETVKRVLAKLVADDRGITRVRYGRYRATTEPLDEAAIMRALA